MSKLARNTVYNLVGAGFPLALFFLTIPVYVSLIGADRYGVLAIVWLVLGVFGLLDMGLGRAVTQRVALMKSAEASERRNILGTALVSNIIIGSVGAVIMGGVGYIVFASGMELEADLRQEALQVVPLMAIGVPIVTTLSVLNGALQGRELFFQSNRAAILNSSLFQLLPLAVAFLWGPQLFHLVAAALLARLIAVLLLWSECTAAFGKGLLKGWKRSELYSLMSFGGWVTLTGVVGITLVFSDRLLIGATLGAVAVTIYAIPLDATRRIAMISDALTNAMFPRLASSEKEQSNLLTEQAVKVLYAASTPLVATLIVIAEPFAIIWLGEEIGRQSAPLLQILAIAGWINIFAKPPYAKLQAQGRPKVVALTLSAEVPIYLISLWVALDFFGLIGAAYVHLARNTADFILLSIAADKRIAQWRLLGPTFLLLLISAIILSSLSSLNFASLVVLGLVVGCLTAILSWNILPLDVRANSKSILASLIKRAS